MRCVIIAFFLTCVSFAQVKDGISIVQYTANFAQQVELKDFRDYNTETFYISESGKVFDKEKIKYLPTVVLYSDGEEIIKIESGISLKLPENWKEQLQERIDYLLEQRF